jgi:carboxylate-amine ligase
VDVNYGRSAPFSLGVEEEFQLVSAESYELVQRFDEVAGSLADDVTVTPELTKSTVEVATDIARDVGEAVEGARRLRASLSGAADEQGARILAAGTHPFSRWEHQEISDAPRYLAVREKLQWVADRVLIFGLHVHVGLETSQAAIAVANALRTWLPELLALTANSPYWQGSDTGLASARTKVFDTMPRSGLPPAFASFEEYELVVERAVRAGFVSDYPYLWWDLRPHPRLGTVELRVCDAQTRLESVAAVVALTQSLVATLSRRHEREGSLPIQPRKLVDENKWRAARYGLDADLVDLERDSERPAREALRELVELARPAAARLGCAAELGEVERVCARGSGADEQRRVHEADGGLLAVARWLADETVRAL